MFDGDKAQAGRRERLMRKSAQKDAFTDKIGGDVKGSSRIASTPTSVPNSLFMDQYAADKYQQSQYVSRDSGRELESRYQLSSDDRFGAGQMQGGEMSRIMGEGASNVGATPMSTTAQSMSAQSIGGRNDGMHSNNSTNFKTKVNVKRHSYEVSVWSPYPLIDMTSNGKRRSISFFANVNGDEDVFSVQVPREFDLEAVALVQDDFKNGHCVVSIPAIQRSVFG